MFKRILDYYKKFFTTDYLTKIFVVCLIVAYLKSYIPLEFHYILGLTVGIFLSAINSWQINKMKNK